MNTLTWLMRRELWESRFIYIVPAVVAALIIVNVPLEELLTGGMAIFIEHASRLDPAELRSGVMLVYAATAIPFNVALIIVVFFYLQDALYSDRKDRSILFWKSLPLSDTQTVLSKFLIAMLAIPAIALIAAVGTALILALELSVFIMLNGGSAVELVWKPLPVFSGTAFMAYQFLVQSLWYAPLYAWLLLTSAWARRSPILWAVLPPLLVILVEGTLMHSTHFANFLGQRLTGVFPLAFTDEDFATLANHGPHGDRLGELPASMMQAADISSLLASPGLWGGLIAAGVFITGAIWLRRYRDDSL